MCEGLGGPPPPPRYPPSRAVSKTSQQPLPPLAPSATITYLHQPVADILVTCTDPGMVASDIQRKTDKSYGLAVFLGYLYYFFAVKTDTGALSTLFCATAPAAAEHPGKMWSPGPTVRLTTPKTYTPALRQPAFDAIDETIRAKGGAGFSA
jgi:hypothetical protein